MPRGGARPNSGPQPSWKSGRTQTIRVPVALADTLLKIARRLDENLSLDIEEIVEEENSKKSELLKSLPKSG
jgi:hypothetical protein